MVETMIYTIRSHETADVARKGLQLTIFGLMK